MSGCYLRDGRHQKRKNQIYLTKLTQAGWRAASCLPDHVNQEGGILQLEEARNVSPHTFPDEQALMESCKCERDGIVLLR